MDKKTVCYLSIILILSISLWFKPIDRPLFPLKVITSQITVPTTRGTILAYEDYKGQKVPIIADGNGGSYRYIGDVPWSKFSIEEKFDMARVGGGWLNEEDIKEIAVKYLKR